MSRKRRDPVGAVRGALRSRGLRTNATLLIGGIVVIAATGGAIITVPGTGAVLIGLAVAVAVTIGTAAVIHRGK